MWYIKWQRSVVKYCIFQWFSWIFNIFFHFLTNRNAKGLTVERIRRLLHNTNTISNKVVRKCQQRSLQYAVHKIQSLIILRLPTDKPWIKIQKLQTFKTQYHNYVGIDSHLNLSVFNLFDWNFCYQILTVVLTLTIQYYYFCDP